MKLSFLWYVRVNQRWCISHDCRHIYGTVIELLIMHCVQEATYPFLLSQHINAHALSALDVCSQTIEGTHKKPRRHSSHFVLMRNTFSAAAASPPDRRHRLLSIQRSEIESIRIPRCMLHDNNTKNHRNLETEFRGIAPHLIEVTLCTISSSAASRKRGAQTECDHCGTVEFFARFDKHHSKLAAWWCCKNRTRVSGKFENRYMDLYFVK